MEIRVHTADGDTYSAVFVKGYVAADLLGVSYPTLTRRRREHDLFRPSTADGRYHVAHVEQIIAAELGAKTRDDALATWDIIKRSAGTIATAPKRRGKNGNTGGDRDKADRNGLSGMRHRLAV